MRVACTGRRAHGCPTSVSVTTRIRPFYSGIDLQSALIPTRVGLRGPVQQRSHSTRGTHPRYSRATFRVAARYRSVGRGTHGAVRSAKKRRRGDRSYPPTNARARRAVSLVWCRADAEPRTYAKRYSDNANAECAQGERKGRPSADRISSRASPTRRRAGRSCRRLPACAKLSCCRTNACGPAELGYVGNRKLFLRSAGAGLASKRGPQGPRPEQGGRGGARNPRGLRLRCAPFGGRLNRDPSGACATRPHSLRTTPGGGCTDGQKAWTDRNRSRGDG
jgi:hypothetical protein